jgi:chemotaxis protein MotB
MAEDRANAPIIVKRKKKVIAGGHHGGAWKVAYADFVTAMMAFFMLMWLLNATTEKQRKGIADYFNPTIPVNRISGGGEGVFGGQSVFSEDALPQNGTGGSDRAPTVERQARGNTGVDASDTAREAASDEQAFSEIQNLLEGNSGESAVADALLEHILTRVTDEGLIVELFDLPGDPLFADEGTTPSETLTALADVVADVFRLVNNRIAVNGHVRSRPVVLRDDPGWDLSTRQAHGMRELLEDAGLDKPRFTRVAGWSDRKAVSANPMSVRNNRIEVILLRRDTGAE